MNSAALSALVGGDIDNFLAAAMPGGIERQEAQGQRDLAASKDKLPKDMDAEDRAALESLGFKFGDVVEDIFLRCTMPAGWSIKPTTHSMHSDLLDPAGCKRGGIFYKAAFYDRNASLRLCNRYRVESDYQKPRSTIYVVDTATDLKVHIAGDAEYEQFAECCQLDKEALEWLAKNYPDYRNPLAYWGA